MKILIVANYNRGCFSPFVEEQIESLHQADCEVDSYGIVGKGISGYLSNLPALRKKIKACRSAVDQKLQQADVLLITSKREGSPQVIKEALACGCPIVSVDVGDVKSLIQGVEGCYIAAATPTDIASKLGLALRFAQRTAGLEVIFRQGLSLHQVAQRLITLYQMVTHEKK